MKKLIILFIIIPFLLAGCDDTWEYTADRINIVGGIAGVIFSQEGSPESFFTSLEFKNEWNGEIEIRSNCRWVITKETQDGDPLNQNASWLQISQTEGHGDASIKLTTSRNHEDDRRVVTVHIRAVSIDEKPVVTSFGVIQSGSFGPEPWWYY